MRGTALRSLPGVLLLLSFSAGRATVVRVPADQPTIQAGIDAAADGDTVLVAAGTYRGPGNRNLHFGAESICLVSESGAAATTLNCEGATPGMVFSATSGAVVVRGFTIRNGNAGAGYGGGISILGGDPVIEDCVLRGNTASRGGAIHCGWQSGPTIAGCWITDNFADRGGALFCDTAAPLVMRTRMSMNHADESGGAVAASLVLPYVSGCLTVTGCLLDQNEAGYDGGAVHLEVLVPSSPGGGPRPRADACFTDTEFVGNGAGHVGGAVASWADWISVLFERCTFEANTAAQGGGMFDAGATTVRGSTFVGNSAAAGGGGLTIGAASTVEGCTLVGNSAPVGACVQVVGGGTLVDRCVAAFGTGGAAMSCAAGTVIQRCVVYGNAGGDDPCGQAAANLVADPLFCGASAPDYSVCEDSPCLAGNNQWSVPIGAHGKGCGLCATGAEPVSVSWGSLKALYRR